MYDVVHAEKILKSKGKTYSLEELEKAFVKKHSKQSKCKKSK